MSDILVVDDEPFIVKMVSSRLKSAGYSVREAFDGQQCLDRVKEKIPDLLLIDIMMPPPDGMAVTKNLKSSDEYRSIPIILLTARSGENEIDEAMACGADDYVIKPYEAEVLFEKVRFFLKEENND